MRHHVAKLILQGAWLVAAGMVFVSCATAPVDPPGSRYAVSVPRAQFYKYGPAQSFGADFTLIEGQQVTMLQRSFGYSRVTTDDGLTGYIATDQLKLAPPQLATPAQLTTASVQTASPKPSSGGTGRRQRSDVQPVPNDPLFDVNDVVAPLPEDPEKPAPDFRF